MSATLFEDLPYEVQETVGYFLDYGDLSVCVQVCKDWHTLFHPLLWRHIDISWFPDPWYWDDDDEYFLNMFTKYAHLIHSLKTEVHNCNLTDFPLIFPHLTSAYVYGLHYGGSGGSGEIAQFIRRGSPAGWRRLVFENLINDEIASSTYYHYKGDFFEALLEHAASTLEVLHILGEAFVLSKDINLLLCSAPRLKELRFFYESMHGCSGWLNAQEIVDSEWVCTDLEVLCCKIGMIPRPDITRDILDQPASFGTVSGGFEESLDLQRKIYTKLGRLTRLRELRLGFELDTMPPIYGRYEKEIYRQYDCLAMTLDSGLDLLKGLKELRIVGLEDMEIYINNPREQDWFAEHWPHATIGTSDYTTDRDRRSDSESEAEDVDQEADDV
ncbi:hypothetical protein BKA57DRAFT_448381 [Linnemannia elongata]|nr:hypothetical protein BKA57DRAFT_448381 [Linnemannia elongata]